MVLILAGGGIGPGYQGRVLEEALAGADVVFVETYTVPGSGWLVEYARRLAGDRVFEATRSQLEELASRVVERARRETVVVLVPGDPLVATTHRSLIAMASAGNVEFRVIPGVSGVCAAMSSSLLDFYKFGRTITVPGPWRGVKAYSILDYIYSNACIGLHTLALLDISPDGAQLDPASAARILTGLEGDLGEKLVSAASVIVVERAGLDGERVTVYGSLARLAGEDRGWREPASIVIPGSPSPIEVEHVTQAYGGGLRGIDKDSACSAREALHRFLNNG
ncbi:MAG: SAM-dependent methyltransferase [Desulfurococcales archaeon]|nr:SAM-dependent methyltransferase [Desulfurococcales archaeon]